MLTAKAATHGKTELGANWPNSTNNLNRFLRWLCANVTLQLQLEPRLDDYWDEDIGSKVSCTFCFRSHLLEQINSPIVLALDEVNQIFEQPQVGEKIFFANVTFLCWRSQKTAHLAKVAPDCGSLHWNLCSLAAEPVAFQCRVAIPVSFSRAGAAVN